MGSFRNIFHKEKSLASIDFSQLSADMHSHLIPGIDDGSKTLEESIEIIKGLSNLGYKKIIITPHVISDLYRNTNEKILAGFNTLQDAIEKENISVKLGVSAEYLVDFEFEEKAKKKDLLPFGDQYILIELSYMNPPENLKSIIFDLHVDGYKVILAHPERYAYWHNDFKAYEDLKDRGVFFQINILSLSGHYSPGPKKIAQKLIDAEMVNFAGTDIHNNNAIPLLKATANNKYFEKLFNSGKLLNNTL